MHRRRAAAAARRRPLCWPHRRSGRGHGGEARRPRPHSFLLQRQGQRLVLLLLGLLLLPSNRLQRSGPRAQRRSRLGQAGRRRRRRRRRLLLLRRRRRGIRRRHGGCQHRVIVHQGVGGRGGRDGRRQPLARAQRAQAVPIPALLRRSSLAIALVADKGRALRVARQAVAAAWRAIVRLVVAGGRSAHLRQVHGPPAVHVRLRRRGPLRLLRRLGEPLRLLLLRLGGPLHLLLLLELLLELVCGAERLLPLRRLPQWVCAGRRRRSGGHAWPTPRELLRRAGRAGAIRRRHQSRRPTRPRPCCRHAVLRRLLLLLLLLLLLRLGRGRHEDVVALGPGHPCHLPPEHLRPREYQDAQLLLGQPAGGGGGARSCNLGAAGKEAAPGQRAGGRRHTLALAAASSGHIHPPRVCKGS